MTTLASERLVSDDVLDEALTDDGGSSVLESASAVLAPAVGGDVGLWEAGPGVDEDVEVDELFLVLDGQGTVAFEDGSTIDLRRGVLVRLHAGDRTTWDITRRLRKLYLT